MQHEQERKTQTRSVAPPHEASRLLELLSACNKVLLRTTDEAHMWRSLCRLLVDVGGYHMCWAGTVERDEAKTVLPVAHAGFEHGYLESVAITWSDGERGAGPTGTAARTGEPYVCGDLLADPAFAPWRDDAVARGYASSIALPLVVEGTTIAVLNIYASAPDGFDANEVRLLSPIAESLALGVVSVRDRVERQRTEGQLRLSQDRYRTLVETTAAVAWEVDLESRLFTYMSPQVEALTGFPADLWHDFEYWRQRIHPDDRDRAAAYCIAQAAAGADHVFDYRMVTVANDVVWLHDVVVVVKDDDGKPVALRGHFVDITEYKTTEVALRESEERFKAVFNSTPDYLMLLDRDHRIRMINQVDDGYESELVGGAIWDFSDPGELQRAIEGKMDRVIQHGERQEFDSTFTTPDGIRYFNSVAAPVVVSGRVTGSVVSSRDITDRVQLELDKEQLEQEYRQAQKMEAIGRLAGGVAHDFNNMLCAIMGNVTLALHEHESGASVRESLEHIAEAGDRASELTRQLLAFSRKQIVMPTVLDLSDLIAGMDTMMSRLIGEHIRLQTSPQVDIGQVRADESQIQQVLLNLVINARDAMPNGGELIIETADVVLDDHDRGLLAELSPGAYVMLQVSDTGVGMTADVRDKIFEPFFTTKEVGQGTGLGLSTVFGIVRQSGGTVDVQSQPGQGSSFKLYFPRVQDEAEPRQVHARSGPVRGGETVLLVEDEDMVLAVALRILEGSGYKVLTASSGRDALGLAASYAGRIDLLVTDVIMPGMNGRQLATEMCARQPGLKVLFASGYSENVIAHGGEIDDHVEFIAKPYSVEGLTTRVREVLDA